MARRRRSRRGRQSRGRYGSYGYLMFALLVASLGTYVMPVVRVQIVPFGTSKWSVQDIVKVIPRRTFHKRTRFRTDQKQFDFMDALMKLTGKNPDIPATMKLSLDFLAGALVPVALAVAYLMIVLSLLAMLLRNREYLLWTAGIATASSAYVIVGLEMLSRAARSQINHSIHQANVITKYFVNEMSIFPEDGIYLLVSLAGIVFLMALMRASKAVK